MSAVFRRTGGYLFHPVGDSKHRPCRRAYERALRRPYTRYEYRVYDEFPGWPMIGVWIKYKQSTSIHDYEVRTECQRDDVPEEVRVVLERVMETGVGE